MERSERITYDDVENICTFLDKQKIDNFKYKIVLDGKLFIKFQDIPMKHNHLYFNNFDRISNIVHFENDVFILNDFKKNS